MTQMKQSASEQEYNVSAEDMVTAAQSVITSGASHYTKKLREHDFCENLYFEVVTTLHEPEYDESTKWITIEAFVRDVDDTRMGAADTIVSLQGRDIAEGVQIACLRAKQLMDQLYEAAIEGQP